MLVPPLRVSPGNRLVAVASRDERRARDWAREWGVERAYGDYEALLADPGIDVVYIPLPNHLHAEWTIRAARAGKHVLCEKPLALCVAEVDAIAAAAAQTGVVVAEAFMYRHHPQTLKARELVAGGVLGSVRLVRGCFSFPLSRPGDVRLRPEWGGGCLWDVGCYPISLARFVLGAEPIEAFGSMVMGETGVDETFAGQLVFPEGVLAQIDAGFRSPVRAEVEIVGTAGVLRVRHPWKPLSSQPLLLTRDGRTEEVPVAPAERYRLEVEDLAAAIRGEAQPRVSLAESRGNVATIEALLVSAREGRPVRPGPASAPTI